MKLQRFHYYQRKIQSATIQFFSLSKDYIKKNPNYQNKGFYIMCTGFTMAYRPKLPLHGLNLKESLIKKPRNIISSQVIIRIKYN